MKIITTNEQLLAFMPNSIQPVKMEKPLFDKLAHFISIAEDRVISSFTGISTFEAICALPDSDPLRTTVARLVVADALHRAIPSLDIVLTPNGFATVGTQNLSPASKARVDRMVDSMLSLRDELIAVLLQKLPSVEEWLGSDHALFFAETLFPDLAIVQSLPPDENPARLSSWERYLELRPRIIDLEASLAEDWFSHELLGELRLANLHNALDGPQRFLVEGIKAQIIHFLTHGSFSSRRLADLVNFIRHNPDDFKAWFGSSTAELFSPPTFKNKKDSPGYFF